MRMPTPDASSQVSEDHRATTNAANSLALAGNSEGIDVVRRTPSEKPADSRSENRGATLSVSTFSTSSAGYSSDEEDVFLNSLDSSDLHESSLRRGKIFVICFVANCHSRY